MICIFGKCCSTIEILAYSLLQGGSMLKYAFVCLAMLVIVTPSEVHAKKKSCDKYYTQLKNIQKKQRQPNSVKKSNRLKEKELKKFNQWRRCQQGKKIALFTNI